MDGKIIIDGFNRGNGHFETIIHGGQAGPEALCSLTMKIDRNFEVNELLKLMQDYVKNNIERIDDMKPLTSYEISNMIFSKKPLSKEDIDRAKETPAEAFKEAVIQYFKILVNFNLLKRLYDGLSNDTGTEMKGSEI